MFIDCLVALVRADHFCSIPFSLFPVVVVSLPLEGICVLVAFLFRVSY